MKDDIKNVDEKVVSGFGDEWSRFTQEELSDKEKKKIVNDYFQFPPGEG